MRQGARQGGALVPRFFISAKGRVLVGHAVVISLWCWHGASCGRCMVQGRGKGEGGAGRGGEVRFAKVHSQSPWRCGPNEQVSGRKSVAWVGWVAGASTGGMTVRSRGLVRRWAVMQAVVHFSGG